MDHLGEEQKSTILVVDDEPPGRKLLERLLVMQGYRVAAAGNGPEALAKATELTPDVILLDVMMPGMDGFEVCRRLRADPLLAEVPVIMLTALDDQTSRLAGIEAGADDFLPKPFDRLELQARLKSITRLNRYRRLRVERARFAEVIEQADDGYLIINDKDKVLYTNSKARFYLDLPVDQNTPPDETFLTLVQRKYDIQPHEAWESWPKQTDTQSRYLVRPESPTAQAFWLQVDILDTPAGPDQDQVARLRDVTEQMTLQYDMRKFHRLVAHKLRTPLIGMVTGLELLSTHGGKLSPDKVAKLSSGALHSARRLHQDINHILKYLHTPSLAQPGTGFQLNHLQSLVAQISQDLELTSVSVSGSENLEQVQVRLSPQAIELILGEILENAKKFHPQQTPTIEISVLPANDHMINLRIKDDGLTLSPEQLVQVWTPYYQGEKYFTGEASGMGLGLSMVAALVWSVSGTCSLHNRIDGPGVMIELTLPLARNSG